MNRNLRKTQIRVFIFAVFFCCCCKSLSLPSVTVFWFVIVWNAPVSMLRVCDLLLRLAGWWLIKKNKKKIRARVFVGLCAEEIPTVLSVSGLCVFSRLHAWLRQLFYSLVGPLDPTQPLSLADPSYPQRPALHLIRAALAKPLSRAPRSPSVLLPANNTPNPFPSKLASFTCENTGSYLQFTAAVAPNQSDWLYMRAKPRATCLFTLVWLVAKCIFPTDVCYNNAKAKTKYVPLAFCGIVAGLTKAEISPLVKKMSNRVSGFWWMLILSSSNTLKTASSSSTDC